MQITKYTHACVVLERDGRTLVIDPGVWSEPGALMDADAVLVTHEHIDHIDILRLAGLGIPVFAPADAAISGIDVVRVRAGDDFIAAGLPVKAVGGRHASIYGSKPDCANLGYIVDDMVYHPGDSLYVPQQPIHTLFVPAHAGWMRTSEAIDFVNTVKPQRTFPIHDAQINERGLSSVNGWMHQETDAGYRYLAPRETA